MSLGSGTPCATMILNAAADRAPFLPRIPIAGKKQTFNLEAVLMAEIVNRPSYEKVESKVEVKEKDRTSSERLLFQYILDLYSN